jgi:hypothetical protein
VPDDGEPIGNWTIIDGPVDFEAYADAVIEKYGLTPISEEAKAARDKAIAHIWALSGSVAGELCVGRDEEESLARQTHEALAALGVNT